MSCDAAPTGRRRSTGSPNRPGRWSTRYGPPRDGGGRAKRPWRAPLDEALTHALCAGDELQGKIHWRGVAEPVSGSRTAFPISTGPSSSPSPSCTTAGEWTMAGPDHGQRAAELV